MFLQCPSCGAFGNEVKIRFIGDHKMICSYCRSVLEIGFLCPQCGQIMHNGSVPGVRVSFFTKMAGCLRGMKCKKPVSTKTCELCHFKARQDEFKPVIKSGESFSIVSF